MLLKPPDPSDLFPVARAYREAGEWPRAKQLLDKALPLVRKDGKGLAELGAYPINGQRVTAVALFDRSFPLDSEVWATASAAGA